MENLLDKKKDDLLSPEDVAELDAIGELVRGASPVENRIFTHINAMIASAGNCPNL